MSLVQLFVLEGPQLIIGASQRLNSHGCCQQLWPWLKMQAISRRQNLARTQQDLWIQVPQTHPHRCTQTWSSWALRPCNNLPLLRKRLQLVAAHALDLQPNTCQVSRSQKSTCRIGVMFALSMVWARSCGKASVEAGCSWGQVLVTACHRLGSFLVSRLLRAISVLLCISVVS